VFLRVPMPHVLGFRKSFQFIYIKSDPIQKEKEKNKASAHNIINW
jgi:hypothetical protein